MPELHQRFKKKESSGTVTNYIPTRLREAADSQEVQMSGFLKWKRGKGAGWKKNWFVLKDRVLFTFKAVNDKVATDTKPVLGWTLETLSDVRFPNHKKVFDYKFPFCRRILSCMRARLQAWCSFSPTPVKRASSSARRTTTSRRSG